MSIALIIKLWFDILKMNGPGTPIKISRRNLLIGASSGLGIGAMGAAWSVIKPGSFFNEPNYKTVNFSKLDSSELGHRIRSATPEIKVDREIATQVLIAGAGISGLSAGYYLKENNCDDFLIFDIENKPGGNSRGGENRISEYPLGAHYLPIVSNDDGPLIKLLQNFGVIEGFENGLPVYNEQYLCAEPQERLFIKGKWQNSLIPHYAADPISAKSLKDFFGFVSDLRGKRGRDGKPIFSIPIDFSSSDLEYRSLDSISFAQFIRNRNWNSEYLDWYLNYCCRDDFGAGTEEISAWAGLHYFCSRSGKAANTEMQSVLTWPEGNNFLVKKFVEKLKTHLQLNSLVRSITKSEGHFNTIVFDAQSNSFSKVRSKQVIYALPRSTAPYILKKLAPSICKQTYRPWLVANLTLKTKKLEEIYGLSWDSVRFGSASLGYVNATHQRPSQIKEETVITFYHTFGESDAADSRKRLKNMSDEDFKQIIFVELEKMHPGINSSVTNIEVKLWGHGMISPHVDYLWDQRKKSMVREHNGIVFAHSDMSGISLFEEAHYQGYMSAQHVMQKILT